MFLHHRIPRNQMVFSSLETWFTDNPVRFVDAFVEALSNTDFRFKIQTLLKTEGCVKLLILNCFLKVYLYGYLNAYEF
jgi:hypothetical protein